MTWYASVGRPSEGRRRANVELYTKVKFCYMGAAKELARWINYPVTKAHTTGCLLGVSFLSYHLQARSVFPSGKNFATHV